MLFDAAGTLITTREPVGETYARVAREYGVNLPAERLDDAFRRVFRSAPPMVFPGERPERVAALERDWWRENVRATFRAADSAVRLSSFSDFDRFFASLFDHFARPAAWRATPGAREALAELRAGGLATGVVSNFDSRLERLLIGLELRELLEVVISSASAAARKPDRAIFDAALAKLGIPAAAAVYVGDDLENDVAGACAAGLRAIDVASLATLSELPARIRHLSARG